MKEINPVKLMERLGIDIFSIDYKTNTVLLCEPGFIRIAHYFDKNKLLDRLTEIRKGGWTWKKALRQAENKQKDNDEYCD